MERYVDLFAGVGGWDEGARRLGIDSGIGIELDFNACQTRRANGLGPGTIQGDVQMWKATDDRVAGVARGAGGLIASPPCQTFSIGGNGSGTAQMPGVLRALSDIATSQIEGCPIGPVREAYGISSDTGLIMEPLRWIRDSHWVGPGYGWVVMEQVPGAAPVYSEYARLMEEEWGYNTWVGILRSEDYGLPQTRERVFLIASKSAKVGQPLKPLHDGRWGMIDAIQASGLGLGWSPATWCSNDLVGFPRKADTLGPSIRVLVEGEWRDYRRRDFRLASEKAFTLTHRARSWHRFIWHEDEDLCYTNRVPVTIQEAGVLQTFPANWSWTGSRTSQFLQMANAVPPALAKLVIQEATKEGS